MLYPTGWVTPMNAPSEGPQHLTVLLSVSMELLGLSMLLRKGSCEQLFRRLVLFKRVGRILRQSPSQGLGRPGEFCQLSLPLEFYYWFSLGDINRGSILKCADFVPKDGLYFLQNHFQKHIKSIDNTQEPRNPFWNPMQIRDLLKAYGVGIWSNS